jgi:hypothetical protein
MQVDVYGDRYSFDRQDQGVKSLGEMIDIASHNDALTSAGSHRQCCGRKLSGTHKIDLVVAAAAAAR